MLEFILKPDYQHKPRFTLDQYFMGRLDYENHPEIKQAAIDLLERIDLLFTTYKGTLTLRSGYRSPEINSKAGGSAQSTHMIGQGIDIADNDGKVKAWIKDHFVLVTENKLFQEHPSKTPTWVHLQTRPTRNNPFYP